MTPDPDLRELLDAASLRGRIQPLRSLWAGYGQLLRLTRPQGPPLVIKVVRPPRAPGDPDESFAHLRKLRSYAVERHFYRTFHRKFSGAIPDYDRDLELSEAALLSLEDLDHSGFPRRSSCNGPKDAHLVLAWLAAFHASTLGMKPLGLWPIGSYYHLETRPSEYRDMPRGPLRDAAHLLAERLREARYQAWVHGDAKPENFCFSTGSTEPEVRAVDFQYVGGGVGVVDLAYFASCALSPSASMREAEAFSEAYFGALEGELARRAIDPQPVLEEWRKLYPLAWADLYRFLAGWAPGSYDDEPLARLYVREALRAL